MLAFCSVIIHQVRVNETKRVEVQEAFIVLQTRGYQEEAQRLYNRLLRGFPTDANVGRPGHPADDQSYMEISLDVSNELERRQASVITRAHEIAVKKRMNVRLRWNVSPLECLGGVSAAAPGVGGSTTPPLQDLCR